MVSIIMCTMRPACMRNIFRNYERQDFVDKEMIIILNHDDLDLKSWKSKASQYDNVRVYQVPGRYTLGKCLNLAIEKAKYNIIAKFDDDDYYGSDFLKESMDAMKQRKARIIGKHTSFIYFEQKQALMLYRGGGEGTYTDKLMGGTLVFRKSVWDQVKFSEERVRGEDASFLKHCKLRGFKIYSVSKYNYVYIRKEDTHSHTQTTDNEKFMAKCQKICHTDKYIPFITKSV